MSKFSLRGVIPSPPTYTFMALCLIQHRVTLSLPLLYRVSYILCMVFKEKMEIAQ